RPMRSSASAAAGSAPPTRAAKAAGWRNRLAPATHVAMRQRRAGGVMRQLEHFPNLVAMFFARAKEKGDAPFLWAKQDGEWRSTSWRDAADKVARLAAALRRLG